MMGGNRQPFNGGVTNGGVTINKTATTASKYQQINRHKELEILGGDDTITLHGLAQRPPMGTLTIERQWQPVAVIH
jgi:hypothetical protein